MSKIALLAMRLCALAVILAIAQHTLPKGGSRNTAEICVGLLYLAALVETIADLFY